MIASALLALLPSVPQTSGAHEEGPVLPELADLTPRWKEAMEATGVAGLAFALVEDDRVVHRVTLGRRDPEGDAPVTPDTIFYIASTTKPFVAFALAQLAEEGKVDLDAPVKRYLPRFRLADAELTERIRVRDLLCHRYGLNSFPIVLLDAYTGEITEDRYWHFLEEVSSPGRVAYSNVHFTLAGRIVEAVSGKPWRDWLAERVFRPAGMTRTTGYASWMYAQDDVALPTVADGLRLVRSAVRKSDATMHAAGGLGTSIDDLARWLLVQLGRGKIDGARLLAPEHVEATWTLASESHEADDFGPTDGFGLGWQRGTYRGHLELRHGGGYVGSGSYVCFLPELGLGLAILVNGGGGAGALMRLVSTDVHERLLADDVERDLLPALLERSRKDRAATERRLASPEPVPPLELSLPLAAYAGTYREPWFGTFVVETRADGLAARLGELAFTVTGSARDEMRLASEGGLDGAVGTFEIEDGRVVALRLDIGGGVRFAR